MSLKKIILSPVKTIIKRSLDFFAWDQWCVRTWSQEGEDMILRRIFEIKKNGFYVDVGAHHPKRFSNTYFFYQLGWSGINIDANPGSMSLFNKLRPRDVNLEIGVAQTSGSLDYYVFNEPALNGFSAELSRKRDVSVNNYFVKEILKVDVAPLAKILDKNLSDKEIDFMNVDVEGLDLEVLKSNDWVKYRPRYVLVEVLESNLYSLVTDPVAKFMNDVGYFFIAKTVNTVFFKDLHGKAF